MTHTAYQIRRSLISIASSLACVPMMSDVVSKFSGSAKPELKKIGQEIANERAALHLSLDEQGIIDPIPVTLYNPEGRQVMPDESPMFERLLDQWKGQIIAWDGRHRLDWADTADVSKVPVRFVSERQGRELLEASVIGRRHWTKGQRAWLGVMQHPEVADATLGRPNKSADSITISGEAGLAARLGVSTDVVNQAVQLYRLFFAPGSKVGSPEAIEAAACKAKYEHLIWGGAGLGGVLAGIAGGDATQNKPKAPTGFHHLDAPLASLSRLGKVWMTWTPEERAKGQALIVARIRGSEESAGWPDEFRQAIAEAIVAAD